MENQVKTTIEKYFGDPEDPRIEQVFHSAFDRLTNRSRSMIALRSTIIYRISKSDTIRLVDKKLLKELLAGLPLGPVLYFNTIGSTNDEAARWAEDGAPDLSLIVADEQTAGRGRLGRPWHTPSGAALAFSLVLRHAGQDGVLPYGFMPRLTALGALAVCTALQKNYGLAPQIKWPNDVLLGGRKVAGVLAEAHWQGDELEAVILGIGINVAPSSLPPEEDLLFPATCVEDVLGRPVERWRLLHAALQAILDRRHRLCSVEFIQAWEKWLAYRGEWVQIKFELEVDFRPGVSREGQVLGLSPEGALRLRTRDGQTLTIQSGEVHLRPVDRPLK